MEKQPRYVLTDADRDKGREKRVKMVSYTRSWYKRTLMGIAQGEIKCSATQLRALQIFADQMGWHGPASKRNIVSAKNLAAELAAQKAKPVMTEDIMARIAALPSLAKKEEKKSVVMQLPAES